MNTNFESVKCQARSTNVLCLGSSALAEKNGIVDDEDATANMLLMELDPIYTSCSTKAVANRQASRGASALMKVKEPISPFRVSFLL